MKERVNVIIDRPIGYVSGNHTPIVLVTSCGNRHSAYMSGWH